MVFEWARSGSPHQLCAERKAQTANRGCPDNWWAAEWMGVDREGGRDGEGKRILSLFGGENSPPAHSQLSRERGCFPDIPSSSQGNQRQLELSLLSPPGSLNAVASSLGRG